MANNVVSIRAQLACGKLARTLGQLVSGDQGTSAAEALKLCNLVFAEIGAVQDANGVWTLPEEADGDKA